jgi:hypothetical protein
MPGAALVASAILDGDGALQVAAIAGGVLLALVGAALALAARIKRVATREIPRNAFGLCSGMPGHRPAGQALTPWLADLIDNAAGPFRTAPMTIR